MSMGVASTTSCGNRSTRLARYSDNRGTSPRSPTPFSTTWKDGALQGRSSSDSRRRYLPMRKHPAPSMHITAKLPRTVPTMVDADIALWGDWTGPMPSPMVAEEAACDPNPAKATVSSVGLQTSALTVAFLRGWNFCDQS